MNWKRGCFLTEKESTLCSKGHDAFNSMKGNVDPMLAADEALEEEFDDEENKEVVMVFDVEFDDSEHIMKREVQSNVADMNNSSPLQWRNRGKVVLAETENVSLWDVGSLTPEPLLTVSSSSKRFQHFT
ncbi:hypothetical protein Tco_0099771 [Tanacetum coccineum]